MNKKMFYAIVVGVLAFVVCLNLYNNYHYREKEAGLNSGTINVPSSIGGVSLVEQTTGEAAMQALSKMHGTGVNMADGYILNYGNEQNNITLYLSVSNTVAEAVELFEQMDKRMPSTKMFTGRQVVKLGSRNVVQVEGMGMKHFYWQSGKLNYWLAVQGNMDSKKLVLETMKRVK